MLSYPIPDSKKTEDNFWALILEDDWVFSAIWTVRDGKIEIISQSEGIRYEENLIEAVDTSLSSVVQNLPQETKEPSKTIFGLPLNWIDGEDIKPEKLSLLKKICDDLSLIPSGFVVLAEAIAHFFKSEEGSGFSGIIVGVNDENLEVSIFNSGKLLGSTSVARSVVPADDLVEGLSRLSSLIEIYPSRILVFNQKRDELDSIRQNFEEIEWDKIDKINFTHPPIVDIFDPAKKITAVCLAGGAELGAVIDAVETSQSIVNVEEPKNVTIEDLGFSVESNSNSENRIKQFQNLKMPKFNLNLNLDLTKFRKSFLVILISITTFIVAGFAFWWFLPRADITIYVSPRKIEESFETNLGSDLSLDEIEIQEEGEKTKQTTGTKLVGEKARGEVLIQNGTAFPINLTVGTQLISSSDLKFQILKQVSVSGALSTTVPGTTTVEVEAQNIGSEYNLSKDESFKVSNYPKADVDAVAVDNFTGGSSRQISAVSEKDLQSLLDELTGELFEKAKTEIKEKLAGDQVLIEDSFETQIVNRDYSNKLGDEAASIHLSLKIKVMAKVAKRDELVRLAKEKLEKKVPSGFILKDDQIKYEFSLNENSADKIRVSANLIPDISVDEIAKKISGKYVDVALKYLSTIPGFVNAEFKLRPKFPEKIKTLPHVSKNIDIVISAENE